MSGTVCMHITREPTKKIWVSLAVGALFLVSFPGHFQCLITCSGGERPGRSGQPRSQTARSEASHMCRVGRQRVDTWEQCLTKDLKALSVRG